MAEYLRPDVYVEELNTGEKPIQGVSTSVGAMIGVTPRGKVNQPILVTSWSDFIRNFAQGLDTPFLRGSDLPNAVYGFFQNGGSACYIVRPKATDMAKATAISSDESCTIKALDEGAWANKLVVSITGEANKFNVVVKYNNEVVEQFENISNDIEDENYYGYVINNQSAYFEIPEGSVLVASDYTFTGGAYDITKATDSLITDALNCLDTVTVNLVAIPGKTTNTVHSALVGYCDKRNDCFAIVDLDKTLTDTTAILEARKTIGGSNGAVYHPWGKIADPLATKNNILRLCPPSGHVMGAYARTDAERGVHKAPAGETVTVRGFADLTVSLTPAEVSILNPKGVNCIIAKPNKGIVIWGARSLHSDTAKRYVSDVRYDLMVRNSILEGTQWAVFEPNDPQLWEKLNTSISAFLNSEWLEGALQGETSEQAYYVKCDSELNTDATMNQGMIIAEIGYAKKKPAEFVVVRIVQKSTGE